jgi:hypothetical protein
MVDTRVKKLVAKGLRRWERGCTASGKSDVRLGRSPPAFRDNMLHPPTLPRGGLPTASGNRIILKNTVARHTLFSSFSRVETFGHRGTLSWALLSLSLHPKPSVVVPPSVGRPLALFLPIVDFLPLQLGSIHTNSYLLCAAKPGPSVPIDIPSLRTWPNHLTGTEVGTSE